MRKNETKKPDISMIICSILIILSLIFIILRIFFIDFGRCSGESMLPTIKDGAYLFGNQNYSSIERNDIIFAVPEEYGESVLKRVVAVSGDHVEIKDNTLYINGKADTMFPNATYEEDMDIVIPDNSYFVMGDNRDESLDSRDFGCVKDSEVQARIFYYTKNFTFPTL